MRSTTAPLRSSGRAAASSRSAVRGYPPTAAARASARWPRSASSVRPSRSRCRAALEPALSAPRETEFARAAAASAMSVASELKVVWPRAAKERRAVTAIAVAAALSPATSARRAASSRAWLIESPASAWRDRSSKRTRSTRASGRSLSSTSASARQRYSQHAAQSESAASSTRSSAARQPTKSPSLN